MLNFPKTVDNKPEYKDKKGNLTVDLLQKDITPTFVSDELIITDLFLVTKDDVMRPDLITQKMYGFTQNIEGMLKFNGISNPFSINEGDIIFTFDPPSMNRYLRSGKANDADRRDVRNQYLTPEKKSTVDPLFRSFDKRESPRKPSPVKGNQPALPPNYAAFGDTELQIRNGKIVFGPNVTKLDEDCDKPLSKSEFISRLIKNRLKTTR
jgi:hypothetical protein